MADPNVPSSVPLACSGFRVWPYADHFLLEPLDGRDGTLKISRIDGSASAGDEPSLTTTTAQPFSACTLLGIVDLLSGPYVLLVTNSELVGTLHGGHVFRVTETRILRGAASLSSLTPTQRADEHAYVLRLQKALNEHGLFYSFSTDITTRTQNRTKSSSDSNPAKGTPVLWQEADHRLVWNSAVLSPIANCPEAAPFLIPIVQGSFNFIQSNLGGRAIRVSVIARRATNRIGTRMWRRGIDSTGNVANFVESEQILETQDGYCASYVQVRGSIPVHWEQIVDLTYKPKIVTVGKKPGSATALHVSILREEYGSVVAVDLVNQKGGELRIGSEYSQSVGHILEKEKSVQHKHPLTYLAFDFHHVCGHSKFDRLEKLYTELHNVIKDKGYFLRDDKGKVLNTQEGVIRTNCVDCLDRTNVTQSLFARKILETQLLRLGIIKPRETVLEHPEFNTAYKIAWADHGDDISKQYSGTGALKGDFVRFGKRSVQGFVQDGRNSLLRYLFNNFYDGVRQDGLDLITGNYVVDRARPSPFAKKDVEKYLNFPMFLAILMVSSLISMWCLARGVSGKPVQWLLLVTSTLLLGSTVAVMRTFGRLLCDRPRLCPLR